MLKPRQLKSPLLLDGLTPALRQLKDCRHTIPSGGSVPRSQGCLTCKVGTAAVVVLQLCLIHLRRLMGS